MSTAEVAANKAAFRRFRDAMNTCDADVIAKTIDELVAPERRNDQDTRGGERDCDL